MKRLIENNGRIIFFAVAILSIFSAYVDASMSRDLINATEFIKNGVTGKGVKVAVIDYGFLNYDVEQKNGTLPSDLTAINIDTTHPTPLNPKDGTDGHGTGCATIVYDIAPEAELYLIKMNDQTPDCYKKAREYCMSEGIKIVSISMRATQSDRASFVDGTSDISQEVDKFSDNNILAVTISGNDNEIRWFGNLKDNSSVSEYLLFPSGKDYLEIKVSSINFFFYISRSGRYTIANSSYNLEIWDDAELRRLCSLNIDELALGMLSSAFAQINGFVAGDTIKLKIRNYGDHTGDISLMLSFGPSLVGFKALTQLKNDFDRNPKSSLTAPGDARNSLTVGGIPEGDYNKGDTISSISGRGPVQAVKDSSGRVLIPEVLKPEIVAPGGATSSAAPHVAGAAALLASLKPELLNNAGEFKNYIISNHVKRIHSSPDNTYGYGKLFLDSSIVPITAGDVGDVGDGDLNLVSYPCPNPVSIKNQGYIKIPNLPLNISYLNIEVYSVTGEFVKSFNSDDVEHDSVLNRNFIKWDLKNQNGNKVAPGVYFLNMKINDNKQIKKIAVQK